jgi:uncharacterized protein YrrD
MPMDTGSPIAYEVLATGTPVYSADEERIGTVAHVLADEHQDIFDGIVITELAAGHFPAHHEHRFVDASDIDAIYELAVLLTLSAEACRALPEPSANPAVMSDDPGASPIQGKLTRAWNRISGNY